MGDGQGTRLDMDKSWLPWYNYYIYLIAKLLLSFGKIINPVWYLLAVTVFWYFLTSPMGRGGSSIHCVCMCVCLRVCLHLCVSVCLGVSSKVRYQQKALNARNKMKIEKLFGFKNVMTVISSP